LARLILTRSRIFAIGIAIAALAFASCGHSSSTPKPVPTATSIISPGPSSSPCIISLGLAFEPDGGNGNGFHGIQTVHYEGNDENTCAGVGPTATPMAVVLASSVGQIAFGSSAVDAVAVEQNAFGGYSIIQDMFGAAVGTLVPAGTPYDVSLPPPTAVPSPGVTATPIAAPLIPDVSGLSIIGDGTSGVAIMVGPSATPGAIVALTSLSNAPPEYGLDVPYSDPNYTLKTVPDLPRAIVRISPAATTAGNAAFVRGLGDLLVFAVKFANAGYQFNATADDTTLGTGTPLRGRGNIAFDPADGSRALVAGTTAGGTNVLTLVTGLPTAIVRTANLTLPVGANINSVLVASNGVYAIVGTNLGIYVVNGVNSTALSLVAPFDPSPLSSQANAIPYTNCNGTASAMTTVYSVGLSLGSLPSNSLENYLVALGTASGVSCPSGNNATLVALPFNPSAGTTPSPTPIPSPTATPAPGATAAGPSPTPPAIFVQNNMIAPPAGSDLLIVR
jgi:hypothetical protein